jgi:PAS domain S-box-containing protein
MTPTPSEKGRILIVDDDRMVRELLVELLELDGYEVAFALDGSGALDQAISFAADLVISDVVMPKVDGLELCRKLKGHPQTAHIPVLLVSGSRNSLDDNLDGLTAGADDYLDLPFRTEELLVKVARLVERHRVERTYRQIVEQAPDIIYARDMEGNLTSINAAGGRFVGRPVSELVGAHLSALIGSAAAARDILETTNTTATTPVRTIYSLADPQQRPRYLEGVSTVERDQAGKAVAVRGVIRDITEQKLAQDALQESEERYRRLVELSPEAIAVYRDGRFVYLNPSAVRLWAAAGADQLIGTAALDLIHPDYRATFKDGITRIQELGEPMPTIEVKSIRLDGLIIDVEATGLPFTIDGKPAVQAVIRDVTESKKAREALKEAISESRKAASSIRESEARYRDLFENATDIIYTHDLAGNFTSLNSSGERITGYSSDETMRMNVADVIAPEYLELARTMTAKKTSGSSPTIYELEIVAKNGSRLRLEVNTQLIFSKGKPVGVQGIGRDVTERRRSEAALRESQKTLEQQALREAMTHRISQAIRCSLESSEIFRTAVHELGSYLNVDRCSLFIKDDLRGCATSVAEYHSAGVPPADGDFALADLTVLIEALTKKGVLAFNDAANDPEISEFYQRILSKANVQSIMYVAIRVGDDVPAAFALSNIRQIRDWSQADIDLAKAVADQTGIAIRQSSLYQKAEATSTREALVNRLTTAIRASLSLSEVLSSATRELGRALSASRVLIHLYNPENPVSKVEHEYVGPGVRSISDHTVTYNSPFGQRLLATHKPIIVDDGLNYADADAQFSAYVMKYSRQVGLRSGINYPLVVKGLFRGVLCIQQTDRLRRWTEDEIVLVEAVAERLCIGMAQAELFEMVARAKSEWETTFDAMSEGIFIFDRSGFLKRVNRAGAAMESAHPRELLGRKCCEIMRTNSQSDTCAVDKAIKENSAVTIEITPERLNRPLLVTIEPIFDNQRKPIAIVCTAKDLSELRDVQAMARENQSLLTNILESARESIYAVDTEGYFKWVNSSTLSSLGYRREEFIGRHLLEMVYETDRQLVNEKLKGALDGQPQTYEMRYFASDGQLRYARVDNSPLIVEGETTGVLGIARDITEQKEERERAARADKLRALGQLASGVAHDFNNSLAAILGRAQLLRRQTKDDGILRNLEIIQTAAEDAAATVRRIQTFARKSLVKEFETVDVRNLLHDAIEITRTRWENEARLRGLEYKVLLDARTGLITHGSASELREVFVNLIVNAVDAMPKGGRISISCIQIGNWLRLQFADNGYGMPEDIQQKVFEPFFSTKGAHGTGLGLSVSHSIIERHEGTISVSSEPGQGTVFTIELPAVKQGAASVTVKVSQEEVGVMSVLVIDDEPPVRETLADMLEALGHQVVLAESGQDALGKMPSHSFDLVFTDLAMPEMDGWETARGIRKLRPDIKIVLVTGYGAGTKPPAGEESLVNAVIGKPFDFDQVSQAILQIKAHRDVLENVGV